MAMGFAFAPVNEFVGGGFPKLWVKDTPIDYEGYEDLKVEYPQIYYGEMIRNYMIVNTDRTAGTGDRDADAETDETDEATETDETAEIPEWQRHVYRWRRGCSDRRLVPTALFRAPLRFLPDSHLGES